MLMIGYESSPILIELYVPTAYRVYVGCFPESLFCPASKLYALANALPRACHTDTCSLTGAKAAVNTIACLTGLVWGGTCQLTCPSGYTGSGNATLSCPLSGGSVNASAFSCTQSMFVACSAGLRA